MPDSAIENTKSHADFAADQFRLAMRHLPGAVSVVAAIDDDGTRYALTATAVCSLSADPPRMLACVNLQGRTFSAISRSRKMSINLLASEQDDIAVRFSKRSSDADFNLERWIVLKTGAPILESALIAVDCHVEHILMTGTHGVVIADIQDLMVRPDAAPLLYYQSGFVGIEARKEK